MKRLVDEFWSAPLVVRVLFALWVTVALMSGGLLVALWLGFKP